MRKRAFGLLLLLLLLMVLSGCGPAVVQTGPEGDRESMGGPYDSSWVAFSGVGVGMLAGEADPKGTLATETRVAVYPEMALERIVETAIQDAARYHCSMVYHQGASDQWLQADPLAYGDTSVTVRLRVWRKGQLKLEQSRQVSIQ